MMSGNIYLLVVVTLMLWCVAVAGDSAKAGYTLPPLHHLVEVVPTEKIDLPDSFQLGDKGELVCETCHGIKDLEKIPLQEVNRDDPDFLNLGPYDSLTDFCYRCHEEQGMERFNVHLMFDSQGKLDKKRCEYCHIEALDPEDEIESEDLRFHLSPEKLCYGCHLKYPHLNAVFHQVEPNDEMRRIIRESTQKHKIILPLDSQGRVMCITCHNPHEKGVIDPNRPAGRQVADNPVSEGIVYGQSRWMEVFARDKKDRIERLSKTSEGKLQPLQYRKIEKEILLRLPAKDGTLCLACHQFEK